MRSAARHRVTATGTTFLLTLLAIAAALTIGPTTATSIGSTTTQKWADTNVHMNVLSATTFDNTSCTTGIEDVTNFGPVEAGSSNVTAADCTIGFNSTNDSSMLKAFQGDGNGVAMFQFTSGVLDTDFDGPVGGGNGKFVQGVGADNDAVTETVIQPNGAIVAVGTCQGEFGEDPKFCVARYNTDGTYDTAFDGPGGAGNGKFEEPIGGSADFGVSVAMQRDGRIVVTGYCSNGANDDFCLARYNTTGSRDTTFDGPSGTANGEFLEPIGTGSDKPKSVAVQADSKIVVAGTCIGASNDDFCLARYNTDGSRDTTFDGPAGGANGEFIEPIGTGNDRLSSISIQSDQKIVATGYCSNGANDDFCLARYNTDGSRDTTFDGPGGSGDGEFLEPIGAGNDSAFAATVQENGKIVVAGSCHNGADYDFCLARYNTTGTRDTAFDGPSGTANGEFLEPIGTGGDSAYEVIIQGDLDIVAAGGCDNPGEYTDFCLARYNTDGSRDTTFDGPGGSGNGEFMFFAQSEGTDSVVSLGKGIDGKLIVGGSCASDMGLSDFCLASFDNGATIADFSSGVTDWATGANMFGMCLHTVSGGATGVWTVAGANNCTTALGANWKPIVATSGTTGAKIATAGAQAGLAYANLRAGLRLAGNQTLGAYAAPVTFEVTAPNV